MLWISAALFCRLCFAGCNVLDSHLRHWFSSGASQSFFEVVYFTPLLIAMYVVLRPAMPAPHLWLWIALAGFFGAVYLLPYFGAIRHADSSVIAALFALGRIFTPILGALFLNERLAPLEMVGFVTTIAGAVYVSYKPSAMRFDMRSLLLMGLAGLLMALCVLCSKFVFNEMSAMDGFFWITVVSIATLSGYVIVPTWRREIVRDAGNFSKFNKLYAVSALLGFVASVFSNLSISLTKTSYSVMIGQFQPFFVLLIVVVIGTSSGLKALEDLSARAMLRKLSAFAIITVGVALTLWQ